MIVTGFFRCECGKWHDLHGVTVTSKCVCNRQLYGQAMLAASERVAAVVQRNTDHENQVRAEREVR
jgi:hypothetical protein